MAARAAEALANIGINQAELVRRSGASKSSIHRLFTAGGLPSSELLIPITDHLRVTPRWLLYGDRDTALRTVDEADFVWVPRLDLFAWNERGAPPEIEAVPVRRDWLYGVLRRSGGLWFADMPDSSLPDVAAEGETIVCEDPSGPHLTDGGVYVLWRDGELMVRRARRGPAGTMLIAEEAEPIRYPDPTAEADEQWRAIARVLGTFGLREL